MNVHHLFIKINFLFLLTHVLAHPVPNESQDGVESVHESYRSRLSAKFPQTENTIRKIKRTLFYGTPHKKECAIMYKDHEPLGILEPYQEKYRLLPIKEEGFVVDISPVSKRKKSISKQDYDSEVDQENDETESEQELAGFFSDQRYPYIFAKFKIDSRLDKALPEWHARRRSMRKRDAELQNAISKIQTNQIADLQIKNILNDLGLIDNEIDISKREAIVEDENMEMEVNKLKLNKLQEKEASSNELKKNRISKSSAENEDNVKENKPCLPENKKSESLLLSEGVNLLDNTQELSNNFEKSSQLNEGRKRERFEKKIEEQIRQRLQQLKKEVKREINEMKSKKGETDSLRSDIKEGQKRREKRNIVNTLTDEESFELSPLFNEMGNLKSHIRRKRGSSSTEFKKSLTKKRELKKKANTFQNKSVILRRLKHAEEPSEADVSDKQAKSNKRRDNDDNSGNHNNKACNCNKEGDCKCKSSQPEEKMPRNFKSCPCGKTDNSGNCQCGFVNRDVNNNEYCYDDDTTEEQHFLNDNKSNEKRKRNANLSYFQFQKNNLVDGKYTLDLHPDIYRITADFQGDIRKRDLFNKFVGIDKDKNKKGVLAIREKNEFSHKRCKRMTKNKTGGDRPLQLAHMPAEDIFGPLSQGFEGELARYKRVKRRT